MISLVVALVSSAAAPAFASAGPSPCPDQPHHCGAQTRIATCCCGHDGDGQRDSAPAQSRVELQVDQTAVPAGASDVLVAASPHTFLRVHTSPPHQFLRDLPTLFASLLI